MKAGYGIRELWEVKQTRAFIVVEAIQRMASGWAMSTYVLFLLDKGLTLFHANLLNVAFMTLGFVLDPSTGRLADRIGQRKVYLWGQFAWGTGMLIYGVGASFWAFLVAECTAAVGHALISEALESWLRNEVDENLCHRAISFSNGFASLIGIPSAIVGTIIGTSFGFAWPWRLAFVNCMIGLAISRWLLYRFPQEKQVTFMKQKDSLTVLSVMKLVWQTTPLRFTALISFAVSAAVQPFNMFWTAILKESSGTAWWLGFVWMGIAGATAFGSFLAAKVRNKGISKAISVIGLPMIFPYLFPKTLPILGGLLSHEIGRGAIRPLLFTYSNQFIKDEYRSTANSVRSSAWGMGAAIGLAISGVLTLLRIKVNLPVLLLQLVKTLFNRSLPAFVILQFSPLQIWCLSAIALIGVAIYAWRKQ